MSKIALFINGQLPKKFPSLKQYDKVFCTDGAYLYLIQNNFQPDIVSGDFDSFPKEKVSREVEVIETLDQNYTDFEKVLQIIVDKGYKNVDVYGASGKEQDHFLGNLSAALNYKNKLNLLFFDDYSYYFFIDKETVLEGYKDRIISLYPFPIAKNIQTKGLKYPLINEDLSILDRIGIRNTAISDEVNISFEEGELLIFIKLDDKADTTKKTLDLKIFRNSAFFIKSMEIVNILKTSISTRFDVIL